MAEISITINIHDNMNGLNSFIKKQRFSGWSKTKQNKIKTETSTTCYL